MKKFYFYFFFFVLILFISVNNASAFVSPSFYPVQVTSTRDFRTPPVTPTPYSDGRVLSDLNFSCPANGVSPVGYGEIDPDPSWLASCGHCLPTPTNIYDGYVSPLTSGSLMLFGGDGMSTSTSNDGHQYYFGISNTPSFTRVYLSKEDVIGLGVQSMYLTIRFAGYDAMAFGDLDENADPVYFSIFYDEDLLSSISFPMDQLPNEYVFTFDLPLEYVSHTLDFVLSNEYGSMVGDPDFMHRWGCTRIYITEQDERGTFENFTCPLYSSVTCSQQNVTPVSTPVLSDGFITLDFTEGSIDCDDYLNGLRCDFYPSLPVDGGGQTANVIFTRHDVPTVYMRVEGVATGISTYGHFGITKNEGSVGGGTWSYADGETNKVGTNVWSVFEDDYTDSIFTYANMGVYSSYAASFTGVIYLLPQPYVEYDEGSDDCVLIGTPVSPYSQTTGNYCEQVLPNGRNTRYDFDLIEEGGRECVQIPYFSLIEFVPDWLVSIMDPNFVSFMNSWAFFPASTFCTHTVDFKVVYFLNIPLPIGHLFFLSVMVWVAFRISRK